MCDVESDCGYGPMTSSGEMMGRICNLETQLAHTGEKVKMREHVIEQLEEEIKAKERLIYEQSHLIQILENEQTEQTKFDAESINSDSEITIIERHLVSSSPTKSSSPPIDYRERLEQALVDRERLELQNEQLLKQWEDALEYVSRVQKQLQEELKRNATLQAEHNKMTSSSGDDVIIVTRSLVHFLSIVFIFIAFYLYSL